MAIIVINSLLRAAMETGNGAPAADQTYLSVQADSVRGVIEELDSRFPGSRAELTAAAVAIDGHIFTHALSEKLVDESELVFLPEIAGG